MTSQSKVDFLYTWKVSFSLVRTVDIEFYMIRFQSTVSSWMEAGRQWVVELALSQFR
jgi:hypothetical protein